MKNKLKIGFVAVVALLATGCNKDIWDFNYTFDYAICDFPGLPERIEIEQWTDYDGEQIQIQAKDGKTYLASSNYCVLVND